MWICYRTPWNRGLGAVFTGGTSSDLGQSPSHANSLRMLHEWLTSCNLKLNAQCRGLRNCLSKFGMVRNGMSKILRNRFGMEFNKFRGTAGLESKFVWIIHVTKHCEICELLADSIVGISPAFLAAFREPTIFGIPNFSEFRLFWNSTNSSVWHGSVSVIPIPNRISGFCRLQVQCNYLPVITHDPIYCQADEVTAISS